MGADEGYNVTTICDCQQDVLRGYRDLTNFTAAETNWASEDNQNWTALTKDNVQKERIRLNPQLAQTEKIKIMSAAGHVSADAAVIATTRTKHVRPNSAASLDRRRLGWKPSHDMQRRREGFHPLFNQSIQ